MQRKKKVTFSKGLLKGRSSKKTDTTTKDNKSTRKKKKDVKVAAMVQQGMKKQQDKLKKSSEQFMNRKKRNVSIRVQLIAAFLIVTIVPIMVIGTSFSNVAKSSVDELIDMFTGQILQQSKSTMNMMIREVENQSYMLLGDTEFNSILKASNAGIDNAYDRLKNEEKISDRLQQVVFSVDSIKGASIYLINQERFLENGQGFDGTLKTDMVEQGFIEEALEGSGKSIWVDSFMINSDGDPYLMRRLMDMVTSTDVGVLIFTIDKRVFQQNISTGNSEEVDTEMMAECTYNIVNPEGTILLSSDGELVGQEQSSRQLILGDIKAGLTFDKLSDNKAYTSYAQIDNGWILVSEMKKKEAMSNINGTMFIGYIAMALFIVVSMVLAYAVSIGVVRPIEDLIKLMDIVKEGDFTKRSPYVGKAEIGRLSTSFNIMLERVGALISNTSGTLGNVKSEASKVNKIAGEANVSSTQIASAVESITKGSSEQAEEAELATSSLDDYVDKVKRADDSFSQVYEVTMNTKEISSQAVTSIDKLKSNTNVMLDMASIIESNVVELQSQSTEISKITQMINAIADQTNLLALNATIEAARAGEAGRGFAVVADEVRKLAEQSKQAAQLINNLIGQMHDKTNLTVSTVKESDYIYKEQGEAVDETAKAFTEIEEHMQGIMDKIVEVMAMGESRNEAQGKVIDSITSMAAVAEENAASTEEVMASSQEQVAGAEHLSAMSNGLIEVVEELNQQLKNFKV